MSRRRADTYVPVTPSTHCLPALNELPADDPTVVALTTPGDDVPTLPPPPMVKRARLR